MDEEPAQIVGVQQPDLATSAVIGVEQRCHGAADRPVRQSADQRRHPDHQGRPPTGRDEVLGLPVQLRVAGGVDRNEQPGARPGRGIGDKHDTGETSRLRHTGLDRGEVDDGVGGVREINQGRCVQRSVHRLHPRVEIAALGLCDACHVVPRCDQMPGRQAAELTGGTGDQYSHRPRPRTPSGEDRPTRSVLRVVPESRTRSATPASPCRLRRRGPLPRPGRRPRRSPVPRRRPGR